ncbi:hypothetical protein LC087_15370 [Bacillus carboniphilus]|uniref:Endospore appendages core domain-containing protein n=1 Tax=Bacillus carboniphilus TaxID=86663 RepID=A0ABY9JRU4_9BACI|nr:S-Ena type endospore appendage [Bacillus carboniphilus]WLR42127.1 hypothetical protein LC087_15370 [Bacillus carboniphilus]
MVFKNNTDLEKIEAKEHCHVINVDRVTDWIVKNSKITIRKKIKTVQCVYSDVVCIPFKKKCNINQHRNLWENNTDYFIVATVIVKNHFGNVTLSINKDKNFTLSPNQCKAITICDIKTISLFCKENKQYCKGILELQLHYCKKTFQHPTQIKELIGQTITNIQMLQFDIKEVDNQCRKRINHICTSHNTLPISQVILSIFGLLQIPCYTHPFFPLIDFYKTEKVMLCIPKGAKIKSQLCDLDFLILNVHKSACHLDIDILIDLTYKICVLKKTKIVIEGNPCSSKTSY